MTPKRPRVRSRPRSLTRVALWVLLLAGFGWGPSGAGMTGEVAEPPEPSERTWIQILEESAELDLPSAFLTRIPRDFVTITFADLHAYAAEYHPVNHVMILNRPLSLNAAGGALRPLDRLTHRELATLYHELFHAYLDFVSSEARGLRGDPPSRRLLAFAREQAACRYRVVEITPIRQRKARTETRFLTESEAWEAMNETWAVFVEWAIWALLHARERAGGADERVAEAWLRLLQEADRKGQLVGFYEPADPEERAITPKRYLAPTHRLSPEEATVLLEVVLGHSQDFARSAARLMEAPEGREAPLPGCPGHSG